MQSAAFLGKVFVGKKEQVGVISDSLQESKEIMQEIDEVLTAIKCVDTRFEFETEGDMIESLIFEKRALLCRYRHLLSLAKRNSVTCAPTIH